MSRIEQIIGEIEDYIEQCKPYPLSNTKIVVNKEELGELLVELRLQIPSEVKQYQKIISNQEAIINDARSQANSMVAEANRMTEQLVDEHEIMQKAYTQANKLIEDANTQAAGILDSANNEANNIRVSSIRYTDDMLKSLQTIINHTMEGTQSKFDGLQATLKSSYDIVTSNRRELASTGVATPDSETGSAPASGNQQ
jgi:cell division septum initiation protein DivIVA